MAPARDILNNLQALRAYAAAAVLVVHLAQVYGMHSSFGLCGVDVFFVLSGFVMAMLANREKDRFLTRRLIRIVPLYWACTLGVFLVAVMKPDLLHSTKPDWTNLLKSLFFFPYRKESGAIQPLLFLGWTLNYEMFFYAVISAVLCLKLVKPWIWVSVVISFLPVCRNLLPPLPTCLQFYSHPIVFEFLLGIIVYHAALRVRPRPNDWRKIMVLLLGTLVLLPILEMRFGVAHRHLLLGLPAAVAIFSAVWLERSGHHIRNGLLLLAGNSSYVLYLSHPYVLQVGEKALRLDSIASAAPKVLAGVVLVFVALLFASCIHVYLEVPVVRFLKRIFLSSKDTVRGTVRGPVSAVPS